MTDVAKDTPSGASSQRLSYPRIFWPVFAIFLVFILARYMQWGARRDLLATIRIEFLTGGLAVVASVLKMSGLPPFQPVSRRIFLAIFMLLIAITLQVPFAADRVLANLVFSDRVLKFAMLALLVAVQVRSPSAMTWFLGAFLLSMFYITQEAVQGLISGGLVWQNQGVMRLHGAVPIYGQPNSLGGVSVSVVPFCIFLLPVLRRWWQRAGLLALLGTATICVIYTGSRTAYIGYVAFVLMWIATSRHRKRLVACVAILAVAAVMFLPAQYKARFLSIGGEEAEGNSRTGRIQIMEDAVVVFAKHPAGVGVASFPAVRQQMFGRSQDTHNLYLEVATNLGIQGLVIFLGFIGYVGCQLVATWRGLERRIGRLDRLRKRIRAATQEQRAIRRELADLRFLSAAAQSTIFFLFIRLVVGFFGMDLYEIYWWFAAGMAIGLHEIAFVAFARAERLEAMIGEQALPAVGAVT